MKKAILVLVLFLPFLLLAGCSQAVVASGPEKKEEKKESQHSKQLLKIFHLEVYRVLVRFSIKGVLKENWTIKAYFVEEEKKSFFLLQLELDGTNEVLRFKTPPPRNAQEIPKIAERIANELKKEMIKLEFIKQNSI